MYMKLLYASDTCSVTLYVLMPASISLPHSLGPLLLPNSVPFCFHVLAPLDSVWEGKLLYLVFHFLLPVRPPSPLLKVPFHDHVIFFLI